MYKRKHHCRVCGLIFCNPCSSYFTDSSVISSDIRQGIGQLVRCCKQCHDQLVEKMKHQKGNGEHPSAAAPVDGLSTEENAPAELVPFARNDRFVIKALQDAAMSHSSLSSLSADIMITEGGIGMFKGKCPTYESERAIHRATVEKKYVFRAVCIHDIVFLYVSLFIQGVFSSRSCRSDNVGASYCYTRG